MLHPDLQYKLDRMNSSAQDTKLGTRINEQVGCLIGTYRFSRDGGAVGDITLKNDQGVAVTLPTGATVLSVFTRARAALTSGGSATIDLNLNSANDLLAASAYGDHTLGAKVQGIPDLGTLADSVTTTAERTLTMSINVAALTAGALDVYVMYVLQSSVAV
jgi:hypothetical protein